MTSGRLAAEAIVEAHDTGNFTAQGLSSYEKNLRNSYVIQDLKKYKNASHLFETNPQYFNEYIPVSNMALQEMLTVDGLSKQGKQKLILKRLLSENSLFSLGKDLYQAWKAMR